MSRLCLDTSAYSQFKRGHPAAVDLIDRAEWIGVPTIVLGETNDIWIAASAVRTGSPLLTYDAHFRRIERLDSVILDPKAR